LIEALNGTPAASGSFHRSRTKEHVEKLGRTGVEMNAAEQVGHGTYYLLLYSIQLCSSKPLVHKEKARPSRLEAVLRLLWFTF
jgi:hypothetical protein